LLSYTRYVQKRSWKAYVTAVLMLILGLMSKPMLVTTPFVLLILDYWPFARLSRASLKKVVIEKIPFLLCAAASVPMTLLAQRGAISTATSIPLPVRAAIAATSYIAYLGKTPAGTSAWAISGVQACSETDAPPGIASGVQAGEVSAATGDVCALGNHGQIWRSNDGAATWTSIRESNGFPQIPVGGAGRISIAEGGVIQGRVETLADQSSATAGRDQLVGA